MEKNIENRNQAEAFVVDPKQGYFTCSGVDVLAFNDNYAAGHQSGIGILMNGRRMAMTGDVRFEQTPGQWQPVPVLVSRDISEENNSVCANLHYPDERQHMRGFNPLIYPDLVLDYSVTLHGEGRSVSVTVNLNDPLPAKFLGKACFNLEIPPAHVLGHYWMMDDTCGLFPQQPNGPTKAMPSVYEIGGIYPRGDALADEDMLTGHGKGYNPMRSDEIIGEPYACGHSFTVCPEEPLYSFTVTSEEIPLKLYDGRMNQQNGWFVLCAELPVNRAGEVLKLTISPVITPEWRYPATVQVSQVGYHVNQDKCAVIETDPREEVKEAILYRLGAVKKEVVLRDVPKEWGMFLRYRYFHFPFDAVKEEGLYQIAYGESCSNVFRIAKDVYDRGVWQPVLEYFLPVQMCHMKVSEKYRVWHGLCHMDDAEMAPVNFNHFDGYMQGPSTLTKYQPGEHVPGLNKGGWHDAGDYDLRVESQAGELYNLALAYEEFGVDYDATTIDQEAQSVEIHQPDGKNDILQQIEHGLLTVLGGYHALGRLYRGIICRDLRQYVLLGDAREMTDGAPEGGDDRLVFTEDNPNRELSVSAQLAAAARAMRDYDTALSEDCIKVAEELYRVTKDDNAKGAKYHAAAELFLTTGRAEYRDYLTAHFADIKDSMNHLGWVAARVSMALQDEAYTAALRASAKEVSVSMMENLSKNPYGTMFYPRAWGAGWEVQGFAARYYYLHKAMPDIFLRKPLTDALNFVLGCHHGFNTASYASGIGAESVIHPYCINRADGGFIPGGVVSGTELIAPDFPELMKYPYLWQQGEYVLGGGSSNYMFLVLAVRDLMR